MARIVLVSRSATAVAAQANALAPNHDVTVVSSETSCDALDPQVELIAARDPDQELASRYFNHAHAYSAEVWKTIASRFAGEAPEYIEFGEPCADATVAVQARISGDELLAETRIAIRGQGGGERPEEPLEARVAFDMERFALDNADCVLQPGDDYESLLGSPPAPGPRRCEGGPLVSVIIPYFKMSEFIERTVESVFAQEYRPLEVIVVNDGSFLAEDAVLFDLAERYPIELISRANGGLGAARNFGIAQSRGRYVLPLDADNVILPGFIERAVGVLEASPDVAYVTAWSTYVDPDDQPLGDELGYQPIGNELRALDEINVAGDALAVIPRSVFRRGFRYRDELRSLEDRLFYRELAVSGLYGVVIPERLFDYRVREDSLFRSVGDLEREQLLRQMDEIIEERKRELA